MCIRDSYLLVALVFLGLPTLVVQRLRREDPASAGMTYGSLPRGLMWGLGLTLMTLPLFVTGYHLWHTQVHGWRADPGITNSLRWPLVVEGFPNGLRAKTQGLYLWHEKGHLRVWWRPTPNAAPPSLHFEHDPETLELIDTRGLLSQRTDQGWQLSARRGQQGGATLRYTGDQATEVKVHIQQDGKAMALEQIHLGMDGHPERLPITLALDAWWLLNALLTQLLLVALPEEYFYRGYIQPTLLRMRGPPDMITVRHQCIAIVITSTLFALGHIAVVWHWSRLLVFFPSLLFGALRIRSGGLIAPIIFHAACNLMVEWTRVHYFTQ